jgi:hypothetical protein
LREGEESREARSALTDSTQVLVTLPGDRYSLIYDLPSGHDTWELFLESRGYYLEWMRNEWLVEEDPHALTQMFLDPAGAMRRLAPEFKEIEPHMEEVFWGSRYASP